MTAPEPEGLRERLETLADEWERRIDRQYGDTTGPDMVDDLRTLLAASEADRATPTDDLYAMELDRRLGAEKTLQAVLEVVETYESCGPKQQSTRDVLAAVRKALEGSEADRATAGERIVLTNAGPWEHMDGTSCPYYMASRPRPDEANYWWCTEHQQHVRPATPPADDSSERENPNTATPECDWCGECEWCLNLHIPVDDTPDATANEPLSEADDDDGPECENCGKTTCPDADLPMFSEPRECEFASMYEAFRDSKDCDYGCGRDYSTQAVRLWLMPEMERLFAAREAAAATRARAEGAAAERGRIAEAIEAERPEVGLHINVNSYREGRHDGMTAAARIARGDS